MHYGKGMDNLGKLEQKDIGGGQSDQRDCNLYCYNIFILVKHVYARNVWNNITFIISIKPIVKTYNQF